MLIMDVFFLNIVNFKGGQWILEIVDHYGGTTLIFVMAIIESITIPWIYGLENLCHDVEYMVQRRVGIYWRLCWGLITPLFMIAVFIYSMVKYKWPTYSGNEYPTEALIGGLVVLVFGISQLIIWAIWTISRDPIDATLWTKVRKAAKYSSDWGPNSIVTKKAWLKYKEEAKTRREEIMITKGHSKNSLKSKLYILFGLYDDFIPLDEGSSKL